MVFNEVEVVQPGFTSSFNLALAMYNLGDYKSAMNKLNWLVKRYQLDGAQWKRFGELRQQIECRFEDYHGIAYLEKEQCCQTRSEACLKKIYQPLKTAGVLEPYFTPESEFLLAGRGVDSPLRLAHKFEYKLLM